MFTPFDSAPPRRAEFTPPPGPSRKVVGIVVAIALVAVGGVAFLVKPWSTKKAVSTATPLSASDLAPDTTTTTIPPPKVIRPLEEVVLLGDELQSLYKTGPQDARWVADTNDSNALSGALKPDACALLSPAPPEWHTTGFTYLFDDGGQHGQIIDKVLRFATPTDAKTYVDIRRTTQYTACEQTRIRNEILSQVAGGDVAQPEITQLDGYKGGIAYRYTTPYQWPSGQRCVDYDDHYFTQVGTDVVDLHLTTCLTPWPPRTEQYMMQIQVDRITNRDHF